jgi:hypothetical protein
LPTVFAARHADRDNHGLILNNNSLYVISTGIKKVTRWVIERGILGQYLRVRGNLYLPGPHYPTNNQARL